VAAKRPEGNVEGHIFVMVVVVKFEV